MEIDTEVRELLESTVNNGLYQIVLSNAREKDRQVKVKIRPVMLKDGLMFQETAYRGTKVFHENYRAQEMIPRIGNYLIRDFKQCEIEHTNSKAVILVSKKGKMTVRKKVLPERKAGGQAGAAPIRTGISMAHNRAKRYILEEGTTVPFLVDLGVQGNDGRIVRAKYDKYKQINRFLEFIEDVLPAVRMDRELQIVDFGCGKSYLTFAVYYYLHELMGMDVSITGLDLKQDVIERCNELSRHYGYRKLRFIKGDIAEYEGLLGADMVVTLHACDTATDYALYKAVKWGAKVILSVPCCQHEINKQISCKELQSILQYGIIRERMSALITDALRADFLKAQGYETDLLEFIDMEHTPKNILIRAVKKEGMKAAKKREELNKISNVMEFLQIEPTMWKLLRNAEEEEEKTGLSDKGIENI
ncbi:MAG: SAM-dependent methyltransferase [Blautia sp.]|nr:SAM-dependent methyltransferase [Blautia sp.]MCM1202409.1 SAM-dependent methyltransferase [Bacteroides fragilis]